ncbi:MAG: hypothetical protein PUB84_03700 [Bacteroidales bacterium]|nr:hypothetical protein [Bacteroidales bacterium]
MKKTYQKPLSASILLDAEHAMLATYSGEVGTFEDPNEYVDGDAGLAGKRENNNNSIWGDTAWE